MSSVNGLLDMDIKKWSAITKDIKSCYEDLTGEEQSAFDVLSDYWRANDFNKDECVDCIDVIKKDEVKHGNNLNLKKNLQLFRGLCSRYYTRGEAEYKSFQKALGGNPRPNITVTGDTPPQTSQNNSDNKYDRVDYTDGSLYVGERLNGNNHVYVPYP